MNVLLIYPKPDENKNVRFGFSLNLAYISAILKLSDYRIFLLDLSVQNFSISHILQFISEKEIDIVIVEIDSFALNRSLNENSAEKILQAIKVKYSRVFTIAFGHTCAMKRSNAKGADVTVKEDFLAYALKVGKFSQNNYDLLPFPDRKLFENLNYYSREPLSTLIQTSRGCLNSCTFCQRRGWQQQFLVHSNKYVCSEFEILQKHGYKNLWVQDENFTFKLERAKSLLRDLINFQLIKNMKLSISSWTKIDEEFLELAAEANVKIISIGVESANSEVQSFYKKNIDLEHVKHIVSIADRLGIFTVGNFIIGAPMEDYSMIQNTLAFIQESGFDQVNIKTLDYMLGSELYATLPKEYSNPHYFCCLETSLGKIALSELRKIRMDFLEQYRTSHKSRLQAKIKRCGTPYYSTLQEHASAASSKM